MLWHKTWLETRWRFVIGLALLAIVACGNVFEYPAVVRLMPLASAIDTSGEIGRRLKEAAELQREYRGFVWWQWFRQKIIVILGVVLSAASSSAQTASNAIGHWQGSTRTIRKFRSRRSRCGTGNWSWKRARCPESIEERLAPAATSPASGRSAPRTFR
jgi:hypothetical protein